MDENLEYEVAKENVRPLKDGRKHSYLNTALEAESLEEIHQELLKEQKKYEILIRTYEGDDPLDPWYKYILWVEQTFPKYGREGQLPVIIHKCLEQFRDAENYKQDIRYVKLWIKFIELQLHPAEWYQAVHGHGIGTSCALFYRCWAYEYEKEKSYKQADKIYMTGLQHNAQPLEELETAYSNFQYVVSRVALGYEVPPIEPPLEEQRQAFSSLSVHKRHPLITRTGSVVQQTMSGMARPLQPVSQNTNNLWKKNPQFRLFEDNKDDHDMDTLHKNVMKTVPRREVTNKENDIKPGPWNKKFLKQSSSDGFHRGSAPFPIHTDDDMSSYRQKPRATFNVLQIRKKEIDSYSCPVAIFEPLDPSRRPMYCKNKVYCGSMEFSLEELRALNYFENKKNLKGGEIGDRKHELVNSIQESEESPSSHNSKENGTQSHIHESRHRAEPCLSDDKSNSCELISKTSFEDVIGSHSKMKVTDTYSDNNSLRKQHPEFLNPTYQVCRVPSEISSNTNVQTSSFCGIVQSISECGQDEVNINHVRTSRGTYKTRDDNYPAVTSVYSNSNAVKEFGTSKGNLDNKYGVEVSNQPTVPDQSMTVNTKEAMEAINAFWMSKHSGSELWQSSENNQPLSNESEGTSLNSGKENNPQSRMEANLINSNTKKVSFPIYIDESVAYDNGIPQCHSKVLIGTASTEEQRPSATHHRLKQCLALPESNKENAYNILVDSDDEDEKLPPSELKDVPLEKLIPNKPSPGMTQEELNNLGSSDKENDTNDYDEKKCEHRSKNVREINGILQPSTNVQYIPLEQQVVNSEEDDVVYKPGNNGAFPPRIYEDTVANFSSRDIYDETCNTQAFSRQLPSSTPFTVHFKKLVPQDIQNSSIVNSNVPAVTPSESRKNESEVAKVQVSAYVTPKHNYYGTSENLSIIMENSKEYKSSSSSGSSGAMTTRRNTFSSSQWTHTKESLRVVPEYGEDFLEPSSITSKSANAEQYAFMRRCNENAVQSDIKPNSHCGYKSSNNVYIDKSVSGVYTNGPEDNLRTQPGNLSLKHELLQTSSQCNESMKSNKQWDDRKYQELLEKIKLLSVLDYDPFDPAIQEAFLEAINFPLAHHKKGYLTFDCSLPCVRIGRNLKLDDDNDKVSIVQQVGSGAYSKVYEAVVLSTKRTVALKVQSSPGDWEFYISREIQERLSNRLMASAFLDLEKAYVFNNGSILLSPLLPFGTLLTVINKVKERKGSRLNHLVAMYWTWEVLCTIKELIKCNIIHGDIKPDNFLLQRMPSVGSNEPSIQLIDFGRSIDMSLYLPGTTFNKVVTTDSFQCIEMKTNRPWTYQTDLFGVAATGHCLLFGEYLQVMKNPHNKWMCKSNIPRYVRRAEWELFFTSLLNIESCEDLPDLDNLETIFKDLLLKENIELSKQLSFTKTVLCSK